MGIGVASTLFCALVVTRLVLESAVALGWRRTSMLSMAVPAIQRAITPHFNWLKARYVFFTISALYVGLGLAMVFFVQGPKMLDNQFRGGTKLTIQLREDPATGKPLTMTRGDVEKRAKAPAEAKNAPTSLRPLLSVEVAPLNPASDGVTAERFEIKVGPDDSGGVADPNAIPRAIISAFSDVMDVQPALAFNGSDKEDADAAHVIEKPVLADNIDKPIVPKEPVTDFIGGVAIVLENIEPPPTLASLKARLATARGTPEFSSTLARQQKILISEGDERAVKTAVLLVRDDAISPADEETWNSSVKAKEWALAREALTKQSSLAGVQAFSPAIAGSFRADAITASLLSFFFIGIYIWVRFKTINYALAAVVALIHDVLTVLGLLALAGILCETPATSGFAHSLGLLPFKIDLNIVAALLTIAGYSLNDTVIVMDRIRENRGKLPYATSTIINDAINQTFSRTLITGGTTLVSCIILYLIGGEGMRAFAFALTTGLIFGTYSSVAVAAPIVWSRKHDNQPGLAPQQVATL
ncbi:MAG: protein translocase subunit SecF [Planctomycetes bacterium]|nr:protein translocase subunit SecF [Planctomycetota bacterium]